jgi:predicted DCC family thiol-disulfide oxidoreductase YuxK
MISLTSKLTDSKGRHARGWLFFDAECNFCAGIARSLAAPLRRRGLDVAPLQDPRVGDLLGLPPEELLRAIRFVTSEGGSYTGASAVLALAQELWWAQPIVWLAKLPGMMPVLRASYSWIAQHRKCRNEHCPAQPAVSRGSRA